MLVELPVKSPRTQDGGEATWPKTVGVISRLSVNQSLGYCVSILGQNRASKAGYFKNRMTRNYQLLSFALDEIETATQNHIDDIQNYASQL